MLGRGAQSRRTRLVVRSTTEPTRLGGREQAGPKRKSRTPKRFPVSNPSQRSDSKPNLPGAPPPDPRRLKGGPPMAAGRRSRYLVVALLVGAAASLAVSQQPDP